MHVSLVEKSDWPQILAFIRLKAAFDEQMRGSPSIVSITLEKIEKALFGDNPLAHAILLKNEKEAVGFAFYHTRFSSFSGSPSIWLDDLFVHSAQRSNGGGLKMINALQQEAIKLGASHISWTVSSANNQGKKFYNRIGAQVERTDKTLTYYRLPIRAN